MRLTRKIILRFKLFVKFELLVSPFILDLVNMQCDDSDLMK